VFASAAVEDNVELILMILMQGRLWGSGRSDQQDVDFWYCFAAEVVKMESYWHRHLQSAKVVFLLVSHDVREKIFADNGIDFSRVR